MKRATTWRRVVFVTATLSMIAAPRLFAQTTASNDTKGQAKDSSEDEIVTLSPFVVSSTEGEQSYEVKDTLAGSRVRTNLRDVGSAITVLSSKFLQDINATDSQSLLQYTTNTEVGGVYGNFAGLGNGGQLTETSRLLRPNNDTRVRGLAVADNARNYFSTNIPWDGYNVGRVDMQRGPNSMLFGTGSPAGIINTSLNDAMFKNAAKFETRLGSYGSLRNVLDINRVLLKDELAFRVVGLDDGEQYRQKPAYNHDKRVYAAVKYTPKLFDSDSAHTEFKLNFERGIISANRPRTLPPIDAITPWFGSDFNKATYVLNEAFRPGGVANNNTSAYNPWFNEAFMGRIFNSDISYWYNSGSSSTPYSVREPQVATTYGIDSTGAVSGGIAGLPFQRLLAIGGYNSYSRAAGLPGAEYNVYKDKSLSDPSIFNFYNNLIDGKNKHEWQNFWSYDADFSQTFFNNRLAFGGSYYREHYVEGQEAFLSDQQYTISIDINATLPDGSVNPNAGRPYVGSSGLYGNNGAIYDRESYRAQAYGELRADDLLPKGLATTILGRHQFTGIWSRDTDKKTGYAWDRWATGLDWVSTRGGSKSISDGDRQVDWITYLGPSLLSASSASGANLSAVTAIQSPASTATVYYFDSHWNHSLNTTDPSYIDPAATYTLPSYTAAVGQTPQTSTQSQNPANYVGWTTKSFTILNADKGDISQLYTNGAKTVKRADAEALTWQGFFLDDIVVGNFGWRHDKITSGAASAPYVDTTTKVVDPFNYSVTSFTTQSKDTRSWSAVLHMPKAWRNKLPGGTDISLFYNDAENFQAGDVRKDVSGNTIANPTGKTKDYGFTVSALDDRLSFKVNWYKTETKNATLEGTGAGIGGNLYYLYLLPAWAAGTAAIDWAGINQKTINGHSVQGMAWYWDYANQDYSTGYGLQPRNSATAASDAAELAMVNAFAQNMPSQAFFDNYQIPIDVAAIKAGDWGSAFTNGWDPVASSGPGSLQSASGGTIGGVAPVATVDTTSQGIEFELYAQPLKGWNVTLNASKTTATRNNLSSTLTDVIMAQKTLWDSAAGDLRLWGAGGNTMRSYFLANIYGPYLNLIANEGSAAPEIRPWRANFITSYTFDHGALKGWTFGAADRWQQGEILGYGLNTTTELLDVSKVYRGKDENAVDLWIGYGRKLKHNIDWYIQLNVKDVGRTAHLVPISVEPDGSAAAYRIADGMSWQLTNRFSF